MICSQPQVLRICIAALLTTAALKVCRADEPATGTTAAKPAAMVFQNGEAQIVPEFRKASEWIRHFLWVEPEFDSARHRLPEGHGHDF